ncbi:MAG: nucleoid occlusion factor SlmA [Rhodoferax sp.]|uniref:nucleoid occlusion factor SlmA n=1 Tax=Rhodoferax sp. TaxID=50421 RepID=UPI00262131E0|nr:nucleoid occlusion factor SlmA [Rhodoferax sp.]MDD2881581.1 nucleoid occlusion factor SlmA [Rhodoferax sp.]
MSDSEAEQVINIENASAAAPRTRPKPGERRAQILQTLASMLEQPGGERVTTAALAAQLQVSEAALYRHFASKAQMFEGLIDFIEQSVFTLINQIEAQATEIGPRRAVQIVTMLIKFAEKNPGMTRVMVGDALLLEHERLQQRMNLFFDKIEAALKQCLRSDVCANDSTTPTLDAQVRASVLVAFARGRLQRYARSGFKRLPSEQLAACLALMSQATHDLA